MPDVIEFEAILQKDKSNSKNKPYIRFRVTIPNKKAKENNFEDVKTVKVIVEKTS